MTQVHSYPVSLWSCGNPPRLWGLILRVESPCLNLAKKMYTHLRTKGISIKIKLYDEVMHAAIAISTWTSNIEVFEASTLRSLHNMPLAAIIHAMDSNTCTMASGKWTRQHFNFMTYRVCLKRGYHNTIFQLFESNVLQSYIWVFIQTLFLFPNLSHIVFIQLL